MILENKRTPLLYCVKLCALYQIYWWFETGVTVQNRSIWVKIGAFLCCVILRFDKWPWKTTGHLFYAASSFVHHFIAIIEFKLELQSRKAQFRLKSVIFVPCDLEIWWMTMKIYGAPLRYNIKLCASFQSHQWIQTGVTVRQGPIRVKFGEFFPETLKFDGWPWKTKGKLFYNMSSYVHHFKAIGEFELELQSWNVQKGSKCVNFFVPCDLEIWRMTLKNNMAPFLYRFELCALFHGHHWIQTGVTVQKLLI